MSLLRPGVIKQHKPNHKLVSYQRNYKHWEQIYFATYTADSTHLI